MTRYTTQDRDYLQSQVRALRTDVMDVHAIMVDRCDELERELREANRRVDQLTERLEALAYRMECELQDVQDALDDTDAKAAVALALMT